MAELKVPKLQTQPPAGTQPEQLSMTPLQHQQDLADTLDDMPGQVAYHGIGSGKGFSAVNAAHHHQMPLLAVVPASLRNNMRGAIDKGGLKQPSMVVSYNEALKRMHDPDFREFASKALVAVDEAHLTGQQSSQRSKLLTDLPASRRLMMTATPARNRPEELAPLINAAMPGSLPEDPADFKRKFIQSKTTPVGFWGRRMGVKPEVTETPVNLGEFEKAVKGKVHFYEAVDRKDYPSADEKIIEVPMTDKQQSAYDMTMGKYPMLAYKIRHGIPQGKNPDSDFSAFLSGPRQIANHPGAFNKGATDADAPKIIKAVDEIADRRAKDKNFRGVAYSAFLDSGVNPMSRELQRRGIPHAVFTGEQDDDERKQIIHNYNTGKTPVLLISGAGSAGLDLKGTKLMQILEPHWNEKTIDQVRGRAIRYKSHAHLPEKERHVEVQRFHATTQPSWWDRLRGRTTGSKGPDAYVYEQANKKNELLRPYLEIMKGRPASEVEKEVKAATVAVTEDNAVHAWIPVEGGRPTVFLDLDETLVNHTLRRQPTSHPGDNNETVQHVMPNRLPVLAALKASGYQLIGVTNRSLWSEDSTLDSLIAGIQETCDLLGGMLDDVFFSPVPDESLLKPSPVMIFTAAHAYNVDASQCYFVGNCEDDQQAAALAGIPYFDQAEFFMGMGNAVLKDRYNGIPVCDLPIEWKIRGDYLEGVFFSGDEAGPPKFRDAMESYLRGQMPEIVMGSYVVVVRLPDLSGRSKSIARWLSATHRQTTQVCQPPPDSLPSAS